MSHDDGHQLLREFDTADQTHPLLEAISKELHKDRPILCHINADTSWLVMLPIPPSQRAEASRAFFKILIDPWFAGSQIDYGSWFSIQHHVVPSSVQTIEDLERLLRAVEMQEARIYSTTSLNSTHSTVGEAPPPGQDIWHRRSSTIDAVVVYHRFTDHCHKETLTQLRPSVPIIAGCHQAAKVVRSWGHFDESTIYVMPAFDTCASDPPQTKSSRTPSWKQKFMAGGFKADPANLDWRLASCPVLPDWLSISCLATRIDVPHQNFHSGILIVFDNGSKGVAEGIIYAPHGLNDTTVAPLSSGRVQPQIRPLALLYGIIKIGLAGGLIPLNLGGVKGGQVARILKVPYWVGTHEEDKKAAGGVSYLLSRKRASTVQVGHSARDFLTKPGDGDLRVQYRELGSGEVLTLI